MDKDKKENTEPKTNTSLYIMMGLSTTFLLVTPVLILLALGFFLDQYFHTKPTLMLIGIGIGLVGGMINVFRLLQAMQKTKLKVKK